MQQLVEGLDAVIDIVPVTGGSIVTIEARTEEKLYRFMGREETNWCQCEFERVYPTPRGFAVKGKCTGER